LLDKLTVSRTHKDAADSALLTFERFASVAAGLGIVFAVAPWIGKRPKIVKKRAKR
jgi:hypothetical protein